MSQRTKNTLLQASQATLKPKLARDYFFLHHKKNCFKKFHDGNSILTMVYKDTRKNASWKHGI